MDEEEAPRSSLTRKNSIGTGLKSVSFAVETLTKKQSNQDKLLLSQSTNMSETIKMLNSLQHQLLESKNKINELEKKLADLIDG